MAVRSYLEQENWGWRPKAHEQPTLWDSALNKCCQIRRHSGKFTASLVETLPLDWCTATRRWVKVSRGSHGISLGCCMTRMWLRKNGGDAWRGGRADHGWGLICVHSTDLETSSNKTSTLTLLLYLSRSRLSDTLALQGSSGINSQTKTPNRCQWGNSNPGPVTSQDKLLVPLSLSA